MLKGRILIIDDELSQLELLDLFFSSKGHTVKCASTATDGLLLNKSFRPDVIILDIHLPDMGGLEVLEKLNKRNSNSKVIMITAYHDMETTVKAMKLGACEYITKPIDVDELEKAVNRAFRLAISGEHDTLPLDEHLLQKGPIIGNSKQMREVFKTIGILSENRVTVLIEGETGTGKELIAKAIHYFSAKRHHPFLAINCSTIVGTLLESELFGHEKGSFTGALFTKRGKFELAGEGTIFLDEVGDMPFETQAKLLRFLQEKEFERVGGEKTLKSDARVISATNKDLWKMVKEGVFREDLYYRLGVAKIDVPPLRERREDIPPLVEYILRKISAELGKNIRTVEEQAILRMRAYDWPGNVRQLENVLTQAAIITRGEAMLEEEIIPFLGKEAARREEPDEAPLSLREVEKRHIIKILDHTNWHLARTAQILGISRPTLRAKIREYKIVSDS
ncbi:MAG: sigma-54 dependent transcriptional regulator, partial [Syntrophales bacterium LBB04]|nr:sigma-54 dependent transcriptional regulator [Syntrophales bacterium LBB04]